jgi:guanylate kinase
MNKEKNIIVFAGPSGVGKSTLCKLLLNNFDNFEFSVSATTRSIRLGEVNGKEYYFFSQEKFKQYIEGEGFVEWEEVYPGTFYGTLKSEVERILNNGKKVVFDIDVLGAINIKKMYKEMAHIIFVKTESTEALEKRLRDRHSETEEQLQVRIARFKKELSLEGEFDETIINRTGDLDSSKKQIENIVHTYFKKNV